MIEVIFTEDFAGKKKDDKRAFSPDVARSLVVKSRVAKYADGKLQKDAAAYIKKVDALKKERLAKEEALKEQQDKRYARIKADKELLAKAKERGTSTRKKPKAKK